MSTWKVLLFMVWAGLLAGCGGTGKGLSDQAQLETPPHPTAAESGQVSVYIFREANYAGEGRVHLLQLDQKTLGPLNDANYYYVYLWPGRYHLTVHLPAEDFFGSTKPPVIKSHRLAFEPRHAGRTFFIEYTDGEGFRQREAQADIVDALVQGRTLAKVVKAEQTAHLNRFLDTRYDGPTLFGKPHGKGTLTWDDGCRYEGVFNYGQLTPEGKFFFADGLVYMGQLAKGRPKGRGVLMSPDGRVLYAGPFEMEVPHGKGIRSGPNGPEYCIFENGKDLTKSIRQLADEALDAEEQELEAQIQNHPAGDNGEVSAASVVDIGEGVPGDTPAVIPEAVPPEAVNENTSADTPVAETSMDGTLEGGAPEKRRAERRGDEDMPENDGKTDQLDPLERLGERLEHLRKTRAWRTVLMRKAILAEHEADLNQERSWCEDEYSRGRDWCICAPFDPEAGQWRSCMR